MVLLKYKSLYWISFLIVRSWSDFTVSCWVTLLRVRPPTFSILRKGFSANDIETGFLVFLFFLFWIGIPRTYLTFWTFQNLFEHVRVLEQASIHSSTYLLKYRVFHSEMSETKASDWHLKLNFHLHIFFSVYSLARDIWL